MRLFLALILLLLAGFFPSIVQAQDIAEADTVDMGILYRKEKSGSIMLATQGYGAGFRFGTNLTYYKNRMFEFDLVEMTDPTQVRRYNLNFPNTKSYFYSKLNYLFIIRAGMGKQHLIARKPYWGGLEIRAFYYGGIDLGLARPSYLYIAYYTVVDNQIILSRTNLERYDPEEHFPYIGANPNCLCDIYGRGPFLSGFSKIKFYPGLYAKGGFNFEFGNQNNSIKAFEIGTILDVFPIPVPVMAFKKANYYFISGYLSFNFGKRYN
jgi:hypothetical protein